MHPFPKETEIMLNSIKMGVVALLLAVTTTAGFAQAKPAKTTGKAKAAVCGNAACAKGGCKNCKCGATCMGGKCTAHAKAKGHACKDCTCGAACKTSGCKSCKNDKCKTACADCKCGAACKDSKCKDCKGGESCCGAGASCCKKS